MMTMPGGSLMPMAAMSGMASGTAKAGMAGMNMTGAGHRVEVMGGMRGVGVAAAGFSLGLGVVIALL